jgi:nucleoprotein TPR
LQKGRAADAERAATQQEAAVLAAVEKVKAELGVDASAAETATRHLQELKALEERLAVKHKEELENAVATARKELQQTDSDTDHKAAIAAAIAKHEKEFQARHEQEISQAVERGRIEQATKGKLKDQALVRAQTKLKELEAQVLEWRKAGLVPDATPPSVPPVTPTSTAGPSSKAAATPSKVTAPTAGTPAKADGAPATTTAPPATPVPRKPSLAATRTAVAGHQNAEGTQRGRGRGLGRGRGMAIRGAAPVSGGMPLGPTSTPSEEVSILGAAAKRSRDDGEAPEDSLAKRLKPVVEVTGRPVTIRRDRVPPS